MARPARPAPREFAIDWPRQECVDPVAEVARLIAVRLAEVVSERGTRAAARDAKVDHSIISRIVNGETWADTETLARLEIGLGISLWPKVISPKPGASR